MDEVLIVDGYNIIGAWPELIRLKEIQLEDARDRLVEILADFQAFSGITVIVVFDAHRVPGPGGKYAQKGLQIYYTKEKETADELIERLVAEWSGTRRRVSVATSDMTEQHVVFGKGALRMSARELLLKVQENEREVRGRIDEEPAGKRNPFAGRLSGELRQIFEKWRRGK